MTKRIQLIDLNFFIQKGLVVMLCSLISVISQAQLITQVQPAQALVENVLLGQGVQVTNISYQGAPMAIGLFNGNNSNIGFSNGVIMTTGTVLGNVSGPVGPNNSDGAGMDNNAPGFPLLSQILGGEPTFNAAVLTFSFIPQGDKVEFRYVFGSEEYPEYVGSQFNDVFGFFITGPNPAGGFYNNTNIARLPTTNTGNSIVSINNVNNGSANAGPCNNCQFYINNTNGLTIQYDGFTVPLTAQADVFPCSTYTIIIAIADVRDPFWDSGVFLEGKSFSATSYDVRYSLLSDPIGDGNLYEGCNTARVTFSRVGDFSTAETLNFLIQGTAINGVDYELIPDFVTFQPGQSTVTLDIIPLTDNLIEGDETIRIRLIDNSPCPNNEPPGIEIILKDNPPIQVSLPDDMFLDCNNFEIELEAQITGGINGLNSISWSNQKTGNPIIVRPTQSQTITVTVSDPCSVHQAQASIYIDVPNVDPLSLIASRDTAICGNETLELFSIAKGGIGDIVYNWSTGATTPNIEVNPQTNTSFTISISDSCGNTLSKTINISIQNPIADFNYYYVDNNVIQTIDLSSSDVISWFWDFSDEINYFTQNPKHEFSDTGQFVVTLVVENEFSCRDTAQKIIMSYPPTVFYIPNAFTPNADGTNELFGGKGEGFIEYEMRIFDRWGTELFYTDKYGRGWPGTFKNGSKAPIGVYVYMIKVKAPTGRVREFVGHFSLIR